MGLKELKSGAFPKEENIHSQININLGLEMIQIITHGSSKAGTVIKGKNKG